MTGFSERTVKTALRWLEINRWIKRKRRRHGGRQTSSEYTIEQAELRMREMHSARVRELPTRKG